ARAATAPGGRSSSPPTRCCETSPSGWSSPARAASSGPCPAPSAPRRACPTSPPPPPTSSWTPRSTCGSWPPRAPPGWATRPRSRWSSLSGSSSSTPTRGTSCSTRSWGRAPLPSPPCAPAATTSGTTPTRATPDPPGSGWPRRWPPGPAAWPDPTGPLPPRQRCWPRPASPWPTRRPPSAAGCPAASPPISSPRGPTVPSGSSSWPGPARSCAAACAAPTCSSARSARRACSPPRGTGCSCSPPTCPPPARRRSPRWRRPAGSASSTWSSSAPPGRWRASPPTRPAPPTRSAASSPAPEGGPSPGSGGPLLRSAAVPSPKTEITEIVTGLAIAGAADLDSALAARPVANVADEVWARLAALACGGQHRQEFAAAWANGRHFLQAEDGLRGRPPRLVEWKGPTRAPGDEVVPADLRVDHVWLISCKYLSKVLANAAPARLFDRGLAGGPAPLSGDWYAEVAPDAYQALYAQVRLELGSRASLPPHSADLTPTHRAEPRAYLDAGWSSEAQAAYRELSVAVGQASAQRWKVVVGRRAQAEAVLWRLLRIGSAPYFVLGAQRDRSLRLRVMTPWDWRQAYEL